MQDQNESLTKQVNNLEQDLESAKVGFSNVGFTQNFEEGAGLESENQRLEADLMEKQKLYLEILEAKTELERRFREEEFQRKQVEQEVEDLRERVKFYEQTQGGNQLNVQPVDLSSINQSDFGSLYQTDFT